MSQIVLIMGEAGIGKSSLVRVLRRHVAKEEFPRISFRCSQYHQNSAFIRLLSICNGCSASSTKLIYFQPQKLENTIGGTLDIEKRHLRKGLGLNKSFPGSGWVRR